MRTEAYLARVATAVPDHQVHQAFIAFARDMLREERTRTLFLRMADRAEIARRYSALDVSSARSVDSVNAYQLYKPGCFPTTAQRMQLYRQFAPQLMRKALTRLALSVEERTRIRHVILTTCTGFYAPGLDFEAIDFLNLDPGVERTTLGFMGCYAAINALKQARHIVRSEPDQSVLIVNLELCTLHLQETQDLGEVLSFLVFGDGCATSLVTSKPSGLLMQDFKAVRLQDTADLITWRVGDQGFDMVLSGQVPSAIGRGLREHRDAFMQDTAPQPSPKQIKHWAVHPGGRSVLDAVEEALSLPHSALAHSRQVLCDYGNMSSATVMFVLQAILQEARSGESGCAMSFGPGLTAETMRFITA